MESAITGKEAMRRSVENRKVTGELPDQIKWDELHGMTEEDRARPFDLLALHPRDCWRNPERRESSGVVEQQRCFAKRHG